MQQRLAGSDGNGAPESVALAEALADMVVSYERFDAAWRTQRNMSANEKLVLTHLMTSETMTPGELRALINLTSGGMTALLDRLVDRELVSRETDPIDRRRIRYRITDAGLDSRNPFVKTLTQIRDAAQAHGPEHASAIHRFVVTASRTFDSATSEIESELVRGDTSD